MSKVKEYYLEEEYNPIEAIDKLQQENTKLRIQISAREEEYIKLQEENEYFNHCDEEKRKTITNLEYKIERLEEDNKQLKDLCDKYEEEHKTTFEEWKKDINIIDELEKYLKEQNEKTLSIGYQDLKRIRGILRGNEFDLKMFEEYINELKGDNK